MGTSMRPVFTIRPASAKTLVPLLVAVPMPANQSPPLRMMGAMLAKLSTLLMSVGRCHRPGHGRIRWPGDGLATTTLDRRDERGLLAAHEGARAEPDVDLERELGVQDGRAQVSGLGRVADGLAQPADRQRVLGAAVDVALGGADGVRRDGHAFEDPVGVAFQDAAVHERARVALVRVADDVLGASRRPWRPCST